METERALRIPDRPAGEMWRGGTEGVSRRLRKSVARDEQILFPLVSLHLRHFSHFSFTPALALFICPTRNPRATLETPMGWVRCNCNRARTVYPRPQSDCFSRSPQNSRVVRPVSFNTLLFVSLLLEWTAEQTTTTAAVVAHHKAGGHGQAAGLPPRPEPRR